MRIKIIQRKIVRFKIQMVVRKNYILNLNNKYRILMIQIKRRRNKASKFTPNLHKILTDPDSGAEWRADGKSFVLRNLNLLISNSLPKYFRHSNISSFIRQLNLYGFKKIIGEDVEENTYFHQNFKKNYITQLKPIRSFYNQQKFGNLGKIRKTENNPLPAQSIVKKQQADLLTKITPLSTPQSEFFYKQQIAILEKENQRLRSVEQEHLRMLNILNTAQGQPGLYQATNYQVCTNFFNFFGRFPTDNSLWIQQLQFYGFNNEKSTQNNGEGYLNFQNSYYNPNQNNE